MAGSTVSSESTAVSIAGMHIRNPVVLAAGTAGTLDDIGEQMDLARVGALTTKSITSEPREGNPAWRVAPVKAGMLNAIGLANPGIEAFVRDEGPRVAGVPCVVIGSIAGFSIDDYVTVAKGFAAIDAMPAVEMNVSCPNVKHGVDFGTDPGLLREVVGAVRAVVGGKKLLVKLPPVAVPTPHSIVDLSRAAVEAGADALCLCNTMPGMAIDVDSGAPLLGNVTGGLSGPAVHPIVTKLIYDTHRRFAREAGVPIIGIGGVMDWRDAAEFLLAGATAVAVGTGSFVRPGQALRVVKGLERWGRRQQSNRAAKQQSSKSEG